MTSSSGDSFSDKCWEHCFGEEEGKSKHMGVFATTQDGRNKISLLVKEN